MTLHGPSGIIRLRAPELGSLVLLLVRDDALKRADPYIEALEQHMPEMRDWSGRPLLVTERASVNRSVPAARLDPGGWRALGIDEGRSALIIADRWGLVYFAQHTTTFEDLPSATEIEEWIRYLATQCPECGVPDEPGYGEWAP